MLGREIVCGREAALFVALVDRPIRLARGLRQIIGYAPLSIVVARGTIRLPIVERGENASESIDA